MKIHLFWAAVTVCVLGLLWADFDSVTYVFLFVSMILGVPILLYRTPGSFLHRMMFTQLESNPSDYFANPTPYFRGYVVGLYLLLIFIPLETCEGIFARQNVRNAIPEILSPLGYCVEIGEQEVGWHYYCVDADWFCDFNMDGVKVTATCRDR